MSKSKSKSPLEWLAGANKPNALGYVAIDPQRWMAVEKEIDKAARRSRVSGAERRAIHRLLAGRA
jgi:hypothetical protein